MTDDLEPGKQAGKQPGAHPDLESRYRADLAALNERRLDDLVEHVHDELTYNGAREKRLTATHRAHRDSRPRTERAVRFCCGAQVLQTFQARRSADLRA